MALAALLATRIGQADIPGPASSLHPFDDPDFVGQASEHGSEVEWPPEEPPTCDVVMLGDMATDVAGDQPAPSTPGQSDFAPAGKFLGQRGGMVFKRGAKGLGYYPLSPPETVRQDVHMSAAPTSIALCDMLEGLPSRHQPPVDAAATALDVDGTQAARVLEEPRQQQRRKGRAGRRARPRQQLQQQQRQQPLQPGCVRGSAADSRPDEPFRPPAFCGKAECGHREAGLWAIDTVNGNCWQGACDYMQVTSADLTLSQEAKRLQQQVSAAERAATAIGWTARIAPAVRTWLGKPSAGVAIAARSHIGLAEVPNVTVSSVLASRMTFAWVGCLAPGGVVVASLYLYPAEGMSPRNSDLLDEVARILAQLGRPWIVAADWQMPPDVLACSGWPNLVGGTVVAPNDITCNRSTIDYFVVQDAAMSMVQGVSVVDDGGFHPHSPVRLFLRQARARPRSRRMVAPRGFEAVLPDGCVNEAATLPLES